MSTGRSTTPKWRSDLARDCCQQIVIWMAPTERLRQRDSVLVYLPSALWKRIYLKAKKGAK